MNLHFEINWQSLPMAAGAVPATCGIYFLGAPFRIAYSTTESRIFYIGCASNLRKRLQNHLAAIERGNYLLLTFANPSKDNISCAFSSLSSLESDEQLIALEGSVMRAFGQIHGYIPLVLFHVTVPEIRFPRLTAAQISDNQWFKLAKDTGVIYVSFAIPFVVLAIYAELLRTLGSWFTVALVILFPPISRNRFRLHNEWTLEPLALVLKRDEFDISDLAEKSGELSLKYQFKNKEEWGNYQTSLNRLTKNSSIYLGDFLFFLVGWILLFHFFPQTVWIRANASQFWHVAFALFGLACFAWFRVSHTLTVMPGLQMLFVATMVRADPEFVSFVGSVSEEHRRAVRSRLRDLLDNEQKEIDREPSLGRFVRYHLGLIDKRTEKAEPGMQPKSRAGWPFISLYQRGWRFSWDDDEHHEDNADWIEGYLAYLYYRAFARIQSTASRILTFVRHIVAGTP